MVLNRRGRSPLGAFIRSPLGVFGRGQTGLLYASGQFNGGTWRAWRLNPDTGATLWTTTIAELSTLGFRGYDAGAVDSSGNFVFVGSISPRNRIYRVAKSSGTVLQTINPSYVTHRVWCGSNGTIWTGYEMFSSDGSVLWSTSYASGIEPSGGGFTSDGNVITVSSSPGGNGDKKVVVDKRNSSTGDLVWTVDAIEIPAVSPFLSTDDEVHAVVEPDDSTFIIRNRFETSNGDMYFVRVSSSGVATQLAYDSSVVASDIHLDKDTTSSSRVYRYTSNVKAFVSGPSSDTGAKVIAGLSLGPGDGRGNLYMSNNYNDGSNSDFPGSVMRFSRSLPNSGSPNFTVTTDWNALVPESGQNIRIRSVAAR